jgi:serine/threonine protein phosphatase 1
MKKYFVFSDVHGDFLALKMNLVKMGFDENDESHILFSLGDLFDRGPASDKVLEYMLRFWEVGRFIGIRGNHDDMLLGYLNEQSAAGFNLIYNGLNFTINQLSRSEGLDDASSYELKFDMPRRSEVIKKKYPKLLEFIADLKLSYEFDDFVFTHAGLSTERGVDWFVDNWANTPTFIRSFDPEDKIYVFGHWRARQLIEEFHEVETEDTYIFEKGNFIGIDMTTNLTHEVAVCVLYQNTEGQYELLLDEDKIMP